MTADNFYWYASLLIFLPWLLLMFAPSWRYTERVAFVAGFVLLAAAAFFTFRYVLHGADDGGSIFSLDGLKNLFRSKEMLLTGWLNYLSFSLFAGTWQSHDSREVKIPHIWVVLTLFLTMIAGPSGLLVYMGLRWVKTRKWDAK
ncbi:MAG: DUF4281 domain-containing protein [Lewinellaceae bacterium]|nr:DUF4281 domain-containing protein [Lewinellaceae bacterium]